MSGDNKQDKHHIIPTSDPKVTLYFEEYKHSKNQKVDLQEFLQLNSAKEGGQYQGTHAGSRTELENAFMNLAGGWPGTPAIPDSEFQITPEKMLKALDVIRKTLPDTYKEMTKDGKVTLADIVDVITSQSHQNEINQSPLRDLRHTREILAKDGNASNLSELDEKIKAATASVKDVSFKYSEMDKAHAPHNVSVASVSHARGDANEPPQKGKPATLGAR